VASAMLINKYSDIMSTYGMPQRNPALAGANRLTNLKYSTISLFLFIFIFIWGEGGQ
jgi:hypothetical protein